MFTTARRFLTYATARAFPRVVAQSIPRTVTRPLHTSSPRLQNRYRYVRFGDSGKSPQSPLSALWSRLSPGRRLVLLGVGGGAPIFYLTHLETVEQTGRRRFIFMSKSMEEAVGKMVWFYASWPTDPDLWAGDG
jgi:hypothetical protein